MTLEFMICRAPKRLSPKSKQLLTGIEDRGNERQATGLSDGGSQDGFKPNGGMPVVLKVKGFSMGYDLIKRQVKKGRDQRLIM